MAVFKPGSVVSATIEQSLDNCILVRVRRGARTFRGVLFDEKNSVVSRLPKEDVEQKMAANISSLPLRMAVVNPSNQTYSSSRLRACTLNSYKFNATLNSRVKAVKQTEKKSDSQIKHQNAMHYNMANTQSQTKDPDKIVKDKVQSRKCEPAVRDTTKQSDNKNNKPEKAVGGMKRKATNEGPSAKPTKSTKSVDQSVGTTNTLRKDRSKPSATAVTRFSRWEKRNAVKLKENSNDTEDLAIANSEKSTTSVVLPDSNPQDTAEIDHVSQTGETKCKGPIDDDSLTVRRNLFLPELVNQESLVFRDDQSDGRSSASLNCSEEDSLYCNEPPVAECMAGFGLDTSNESEHESHTDKDSDKSSVTSSVLASQESNKISTDSNKIIECNKDAVSTPTKKSARISAKRAQLELEIGLGIEEEEKATVWSIWGASPLKRESQQKASDDKVTTSSNGVDGQSTKKCDAQPVEEVPIESEPSCDNDNTENKTDKDVVLISVGSVVWGKVHGHPWWPGRVVAVTTDVDKEGVVINFAHVTWFGSNTSSIMPVDTLQCFLTNFRKRHKNGKKGCYRTAVRQAQDTLRLMGVDI